MKNKLFAAFLITFLLTAFSAGNSVVKSQNDKVTICHASGLAGTLHYNTLNISENAVYGTGGHFNENGTTRAGHEQDYMGPCIQDTNPNPACEWSQWSECSSPCGGGIHDRYCGEERQWRACNTQACEGPVIPEFPQCPQNSDGDVAHYERYQGNPHQIVNGSLLFGGDDVYSLENGNYLQCFCPDEGNQGIQTNWWRTDDILDGWFREFGTQWNLGDYWYLTQNSDFICDSGNTGGDSDPEVTPTPTLTPTLTPSPSPTTAPSQDTGGASSGTTTESNVETAQVLGATTLADTGSVADYYIVLGLVLTITSLYGFSKTQNKNKI